VTTIHGAWVGRVVDDLGAGAPLGHRLAHQQRDDRAAEAHHRGERQQLPEVQAVGGEEAVQPEQVDHQPSTSMTARLVTTNRKMRFMANDLDACTPQAGRILGRLPRLQARRVT
jgi:hypothetical protein